MHILYSGHELEENLFAAFVRALFSFSKDMSSGKAISSMTLGDMDIHYLAAPEERFFVAISAEAGIPQETIDLYLKFISVLFSKYYDDYIQKMPAFEPKSFEILKKSIDFYIQYTENKFDLEQQGTKDIDLDLDLKSIQFSENSLILETMNDQILRVIRKFDLSIIGTFYPESGNIKLYSLQKNEKYLIIISDENILTIIPFQDENEADLVSHLIIEINISWLTIHPEKPLAYFGNENEIYELNLSTSETSVYSLPFSIREADISKNDHLVIKNENNNLFLVKTPLSTELKYDKASIEEKVISLDQGPEGVLVVKCANQQIYIWDGENAQPMKERYPNNTIVSYSEKDNLIFLITEYNEFLIYDSNDASLLVNYNLVDNGIGVFVSEKDDLIVVYSNGMIRKFLGTIDRKEIFQLRSFLTKRVENVESNIIRIHTGFQKIINNLDDKGRPSISLKNDLNQVKVFKQQLKRVLDDKLIERTSILRDLYFRLLGYQNQVQSLIKLIEELEDKVEGSFKKSKENELSGKTPKERIEEYLNIMKPRDQIGLGTLSDNLQLPYEECLNHLKNLESRGMLPGFLTRGSALSIKDNVIFVKKDPKFEETGITSF